MVSKFALLSNLLLASAALAAPSSPSRLASRIARRSETRQSQPIKRVASPPDSLSTVEYSENWAGVVIVESEPTFTYATGTFTIPAPSGADGSGAAIWVGIDGDTCQNAIIQTGILYEIGSGGDVTYEAFFEWFPADAYTWTDFPIAAGDVIVASVTATSTTSGVVTVENLTTGQTASEDLTSTYALCEENAEWIVEDFESDGSLIPFADFGTVTFTDAYATGPGGTYTPGADGIILDIEQNGVILTSVTTSGETITVEYI